jgi:hypothetical protein
MYGLSRGYITSKEGNAYVYGYITKLCRAQAQVILNHVNPNVHGIEQGEAGLKVGGGQAYDCSVD